MKCLPIASSRRPLNTISRMSSKGDWGKCCSEMSLASVWHLFEDLLSRMSSKGDWGKCCSEMSLASVWHSPVWQLFEDPLSVVKSLWHLPQDDSGIPQMPNVAFQTCASPASLTIRVTNVPIEREKNNKRKKKRLIVDLHAYLCVN